MQQSNKHVATIKLMITHEDKTREGGEK